MIASIAVLAQVVGIVAALAAFLITCWHVAYFAISARKDINQLTETVKRLETKLDNDLVSLEHRVRVLELQDARHHAQHEVG